MGLNLSYFYQVVPCNFLLFMLHFLIFKMKIGLPYLTLKEYLSNLLLKNKSLITKMIWNEDMDTIEVKIWSSNTNKNVLFLTVQYLTYAYLLVGVQFLLNWPYLIIVMIVMWFNRRGHEAFLETTFILKNYYEITYARNFRKTLNKQLPMQKQ